MSPTLRRHLWKASKFAILFFGILFIILRFTNNTVDTDPVRLDFIGYKPPNHRHVLYHQSEIRIALPRRFRLVDIPSNRQISDQQLSKEDQRTNNNFSCITTKTVPTFPICVYEAEKDKFISGALLDSGVWEPYITKAFQTALERYPGAVFVDVGANIGYYSLMAASMGHRVIALEPQMDNAQLLISGAMRSLWGDNILLLANVLSDTWENVSLTTNANNQGGIMVVNCDKTWPTDSPIQQVCDVPTVTLNDLLRLMSSPVAILKLDIEGYECRALDASDHFFTAISVPYIFMEWRMMWLRQDKPDTNCPTEVILKLARTLTNLGYTAYEVQSGVRMSSESAHEWKVGDVYWKKNDISALVINL